MSKDPVCGMQIRESESVGKMEYKGTVYHFCSQFCRAMFIEDPDKFASTNNEAESNPHHHENGCACC